MKKLALLASATLLICAMSSLAESIKLKCDGVKCDQCADVIAEALGKVPGAKITLKATKDKPATTVDVDLAKSDVGALAKAIAGADTPHKEVEAPGAYLILSAPALTKANAKGLDAALKGVKGVNPVLSSANVSKKELEIKIDDSGSAKLADIKKALAAYLK